LAACRNFSAARVCRVPDDAAIGGAARLHLDPVCAVAPKKGERASYAVRGREDSMRYFIGDPTCRNTQAALIAQNPKGKHENIVRSCFSRTRGRAEPVRLPAGLPVIRYRSGGDPRCRTGGW